MDMVDMLLVMEVMVLVMDTMVRDLLMLSQDITDMVDTEVMEVMAMAVVMDTTERDLLMLKLMLSQDIMVMEDMDTVDIEVMEVMDMVADTMDKKLIHTIQFKAINHKFYFK